MAPPDQHGASGPDESDGLTADDAKQPATLDTLPLEVLRMVTGKVHLPLTSCATLTERKLGNSYGSESFVIDVEETT